MEFQLSYVKSLKMMLLKCCTKYASKFGKLSSGHRTGKGQFSFQSQRKAMPKNVQTTTQLHSFHMLKILQVRCLPVHHQLLESTQNHVHCVSDAIQPSHPLLSPTPPALNLSQHQGLVRRRAGNYLCVCVFVCVCVDMCLFTLPFHPILLIQLRGKKR